MAEQTEKAFQKQHLFQNAKSRGACGLLLLRGSLADGYVFSSMDHVPPPSLLRSAARPPTSHLCAAHALVLSFAIPCALDAVYLSTCLPGTLVFAGGVVSCVLVIFGMPRAVV